MLHEGGWGTGLGLGAWREGREGIARGQARRHGRKEAVGCYN
jgi:hypothetical protein